MDFLRQLERISRRRGRRRGRTVVVISDNARYHHATLHASWRQRKARNFRLHFLPPYSPDLNPIERVWKLLRRRCLHDQHFPTLQDVVQAVEPTLRLWGSSNSTLKRLCSLI